MISFVFVCLNSRFFFLYYLVHCTFRSNVFQLVRCFHFSVLLCSYLNSVDLYDLDANEWTRLKDLPFPRCHHAAIAMVSGVGDVSVYITGGFNKEKTVLSSSLRCVFFGDLVFFRALWTVNVILVLHMNILFGLIN